MNPYFATEYPFDTNVRTYALDCVHSRSLRLLGDCTPHANHTVSGLVDAVSGWKHICLFLAHQLCSPMFPAFLEDGQREAWDTCNDDSLRQGRCLVLRIQPRRFELTQAEQTHVSSLLPRVVEHRDSPRDRP
jgi:hypothetical protein